MSHHELIKTLINEIRRLRHELKRIKADNEELDWAVYNAEERASQMRYDAQQQAEEIRRVQQEAEWRDYDRQEALKQLERARQWGNEWEIDKYTRKLRDIG